MAGELKNALPQNLKLLDNLATSIKEKYYALSSRTAEQAIVEGLKNANKFLELVAKTGNVSWLGNLNYAVLGIKGPNFKVGKIEQYEVNLAKVGNIKTLLVRERQIIDMGKNIDLQGFEPYPLKIFGSIVSGELAYNDKVLVLTKEVYSFFDSQNILKELLKLEDFDAATLNKILKTKNLTGLSGICFLIVLKELKEGSEKAEKIKSITFQKEPAKISIIKSLSLIFRFLIKTFLFIKKSFERLVSGISAICKTMQVMAKNRKEIQKQEKLIEKIKEEAKEAEGDEWLEESKEEKQTEDVLKPFIRVKEEVIGEDKNTVKIPINRVQKKPKFTFIFPKISLPKLPRIQITERLKKNVYLIFILIGFLLLGFFIFKTQEQEKIKQNQILFNEIQINAIKAEQFIKAGNEKEAYPILLKALQDINNFSLAKNDLLYKDAISLRISIENDLKKISRLEEIKEPGVLYQFNPEEFIPQRIVLSKDNLYLFSSLSDNIYKINQKGEKSVISTDKRLNLATIYDNSILFLQKPNTALLMSNDQLGESFSLSLPSSDFNIDSFSAFNSNLYVLDGKKGEIIKYPAPISQSKDRPQSWLKDAANKPFNSQSISVDGSVWVLNKDNSLTYYFAGDFQETLAIEIFPQAKIFSKISAPPQLPYIYILEQVQKRLILFSKTNKIIKQYHSDKFDNLKDFAVSDDGRKIFVLNGTKIYQIDY